jgi:cytochrome c2
VFTRADEITDGRTSRALVWLLVLLVVVVVPFHLGEWLRSKDQQRYNAIAATGGNPDRAAPLLQHYGCTGCHVIPGIRNASGQVGPDLGDVARRVYVAGVITNTPEHLIRFIVDPQSIDPDAAMPRTGISADEARDVAAYLYSIRR